MFVKCPMCQEQVLEDEINSHVDQHLLLQRPQIEISDESEKSPSDISNKRQRTSCARGPGHDAADAPTLDRFGVGATVTVDDPVPEMSAQESNLAPKVLPSHQQDNVNNESPRNSRGGSSSMSADVCAEAAGDECSKVFHGGSTAGSSNQVALLQPEEHLRAHLLGSRTHALRCAREESATMHEKVSQLCGEVQQGIDLRRHDIENYPTMAKPTDPNQQSARNSLRGDLEDVARTVSGKVWSLICASRGPEDALCVAEAAQLERIDNAMDMLEKLRAETLEEFQERKAKEAMKRQASEAAVLTLEPWLECLDCFMRHLAREVDDETAKAVQVHTEKLEDLQQEQVRFVNANDSPRHNPLFAKVIEDVGSTKRVLEEHISQSTSYRHFLKDWEDLLGKMPTQELLAPIAPIPRKRTLLDRILGRP